MSMHRADRVGDVIRSALAEILQREMRDPRVGFVTLTEVKVSSDLRNARVYVSSLSTPGGGPETLQILNRAEPFLRTALSRHASLRFVPRLRFLGDSALRRGSRVEELLREIRDRSEEPAPDEPIPESE